MYRRQYWKYWEKVIEGGGILYTLIVGCIPESIFILFLLPITLLQNAVDFYAQKSVPDQDRIND